MLDESKRKELTEKIAYKIWQIRTKPDEDEDNFNPLLGSGSADTDFITATKIISVFENNIRTNKEDIQDYLDLFQDILENYFNKDYLLNYVYTNPNC